MPVTVQPGMVTELKPVVDGEAISKPGLTSRFGLIGNPGIPLWPSSHPPVPMVPGLPSCKTFGE